MTRQIVRLDLSGIRHRPVPAELIVRRETVELRVHDHLVAVLDRDELRAWLAAPDRTLSVDDVRWLWTGECIGIYVRRMVPARLLSQHEVATIRQCV